MTPAQKKLPFTVVSCLVAGVAFVTGCASPRSQTPKNDEPLGAQNSQSAQRGTPDSGQSWDENGPPTPPAPAAFGGSRVLIETSLGDITIQLNPDKAPISTKNFLRYVNEGHYDNTIFHRVIANFMIQGGGYTPSFTKKSTHPPIKNEAANGLKNKRGTVAMARTSVIDSATAQFFINVKDNPFLDHQGPKRYGYAVFGKVVSGMDVVDKIKTVPTGSKGPFSRDAPLNTVLIKKVRVLDPPKAATGKK